MHGLRERDSPTRLFKLLSPWHRAPAQRRPEIAQSPPRVSTRRLGFAAPAPCRKLTSPPCRRRRRYRPPRDPDWPQLLVGRRNHRGPRRAILIHWLHLDALGLPQFGATPPAAVSSRSSRAAMVPAVVLALFVGLHYRRIIDACSSIASTLVPLRRAWAGGHRAQRAVSAPNCAAGRRGIGAPADRAKPAWQA